MRTIDSGSDSSWRSWFERTHDVNCPTCHQVVDGRDIWPCFMKKCSNHVCVHCYIQHNEKAHPEIYRIKSVKPSKKG